ncbi:MAG: undecaprenyl-diphosphatase [Alphaproteobacteria bacterium]
MKRIAAIDERAFIWIASHHSTQPGELLPRLFHWISKSADGHLYPVLLALMFFVDDTHGLLLLYTALMAYTLEVPLYLILKHIFKRPRPCDFIMHLEAFIVPGDKFSLPSGHTAAAFLMATIVCYFYPIAIIPSFIWASAVGLSRVVLRVHFPIDVMLGASLGVTVALVTIKVLE